MGDVKSALETIMSDITRSEDVLAVVIARRDGLVVAASLPDDVDSRKVAAMSAAIVGTAEMAASELSQGDFQQVLVECAQGNIISLGAGREALLVVLIRRGANVGLALLRLRKAAQRIQETLVETYA